MAFPTGSAPGNTSTNDGVFNAFPVVGHPLVFTFNFAPVASKTDFLVAAFQAPMAMRIQRISWNVNSLGAASADTLKFLTHATAIQTSGATSLLSAASVDWDANPTDFAAPNGETAGASTLTLATGAGVRDIAKGAFVFCAYTTDATAVTAGTACNVIYSVVATGLPNTLVASN